MTAKNIAIVSLTAFAFFAAHGGPVINPYGTTSTTTTTTVTTSADGTTTRETRTTTVTNNADYDIVPDEGVYVYVDYNGERVPYYRGYYYSDGVWVWRGSGRTIYPPPRFRPALPARLPRAAKPAPVRSRYAAAKTPLERSHAAKHSTPKTAPRRSGGRAPAPKGHR